MTQSVATEESITAISSTVHSNSDWTGAWTAEPVTFKTYTYFTLNGNPIVYEASCTFTFNGANSAGATVSDSETITLKAKQTTLQGPVLRNGDAKKGNRGPENQLQVTSNYLLTTD